MSSSMTHDFPFLMVHASNGSRTIWPKGLSGEVNLVSIGFYEDHHPQMREWTRFGMELAIRYQEIKTYELFVFPKDLFEHQFHLDQTVALRFGNYSPAGVFTAYTDKEKFLEDLFLISDEKPLFLLVDRDGKFLWRTNCSLRKVKQDQLAGRVHYHLVIETI